MCAARARLVRGLLRRRDRLQHRFGQAERRGQHDRRSLAATARRRRNARRIRLEHVAPVAIDERQDGSAAHQLEQQRRQSRGRGVHGLGELRELSR
jgi:hypothetical protein